MAEAVSSQEVSIPRITWPCSAWPLGMAVAPVEHGRMGKPIVVADTFESRSGIPERLREIGAEVDVPALRACDYELGARLVERKTLLDLHGAIIKSPVWRQIRVLPP